MNETINLCPTSDKNVIHIVWTKALHNLGEKEMALNNLLMLRCYRGQHSDRQQLKKTTVKPVWFHPPSSSIFAQVKYMLLGPELTPTSSFQHWLPYNYFNLHNIRKEKRRKGKKEEKSEIEKKEEEEEAAMYFTTEFHSNMITGGVSMRAEGKEFLIHHTS